MHFPDFFPRSQAEGPDDSLREAISRNRVVFLAERKLKYASDNISEKLDKMRVAMIQYMLPYSA